VVSGHLSQGSGGRGTSGAGGVTQRLKNLVNMNAALMASAQGDWVRAEEILRGLVAVNPGDFVVSFSSFFFFFSFVLAFGLALGLCFIAPSVRLGIAFLWAAGPEPPLFRGPEPGES